MKEKQRLQTGQQSGPEFVDTALTRGAQEQQRGQLTKAEELYRVAVNAKPDHVLANHLLGFVLIKRGKLDEAKLYLQKALDGDPDHQDSWLQLGYVEYSLCEYEQAAGCFRRAIAQDPENARAHNHLAETMAALGDEEEAISLYLRAIELWPTFADAWISLGHFYQQLGRAEESEKTLVNGLEINPKATVAYLLLTLAGYYRDKPGEVRRMEDLFEKAVMTDSQRCYLAFALGHIYEGRQAFDRAFDYLSRGNRLHRKGHRYSIVDEKENFVQLKEVFNAGFLARNLSDQVSELTPIFIVGMPRSGTSLVEQILVSHPDVSGVGELPMFATLCHGLRARTDRKFPQGVDKLDPSVFADLGAHYLAELTRRSESKQFVTDKLPSNFRNIGMIRLALPNAKIIHCRRDAMANCVSIYRNHFGAGLGYGYDQEELGQYFRLYQDLMGHWHRAMPDDVYDISYEQLVVDTENQVRGLLVHCGLAYDANCLEFHDARRAVRTMSNVQVRRPIYRDAVSAWKHYEGYIGPLMESLAYLPTKT